jgi:hypothetical protein
LFGFSKRAVCHGLALFFLITAQAGCSGVSVWVLSGQKTGCSALLWRNENPNAKNVWHFFFLYDKKEYGRMEETR